MKSTSFKTMRVFVMFFWILTFIPAGCVLIDAIKSTSGVGKFPTGEMMYGIDAFADTITAYITILFPFFLLWVICFFIAIISTATLLLLYSTDKQITKTKFTGK